MGMVGEGADIKSGWLRAYALVPTLVVGLNSSSVAAGSVQVALHNMGFEGMWKTDCAKDDAASLRYSLPTSGDALIESTVPTATVTYRVTGAEQLTEKKIRIIAEIVKIDRDKKYDLPTAPQVGQKMNVVCEKLEDDHIHLVHSTVDDVVMVEDGQLTKFNRPTPVFEKCMN
jgi:hypothetical protein